MTFAVGHVPTANHALLWLASLGRNWNECENNPTSFRPLSFKVRATSKKSRFGFGEWNKQTSKQKKIAIVRIKIFSSKILKTFFMLFHFLNQKQVYSLLSRRQITSSLCGPSKFTLDYRKHVLKVNAEASKQPCTRIYLFNFLHLYAAASHEH